MISLNNCALRVAFPNIILIKPSHLQMASAEIATSPVLAVTLTMGGSVVHADGQIGVILSLKSKPVDSPRSDSNGDCLDIVKCNKILSEVQDLVKPGCNLICSLTGSDDLDLTTMHPYIFMEMIKIKETYNAPSQSPSLPNVKHFKGREFLTQTLYLTLSTSDLDALIDRTMNKFKKIIIQYMEDMLASTSSISSDLDLENQLGDLDEGESMWKTMHTHYKSWHAHLPKHPLSEVNDDKGGGPANVSWPAIKCINLS
ncbi:hypothetical protein EDD17DRAFT_1510305 [Pisolithus thermaeus]|nr:hypothetical protein EV401DRAFT_1886681 [Pisolithus croceorrhizus]KAI6160483.1 hypothetical protein EDD17DRAFT_1510305 [Pisolithus thermaeus]